MSAQEPPRGADSGAVLTEEARQILDSAASRDVTLRLMGGIAVRVRCPGQADTFQRFGRHYSDVDVVAVGRHVKGLRDSFVALGYTEDSHVYVDSAGSRIVAYRPASTTHVDVFLDDLEFCHTIPMKGRLEVDDVTLPLAELVLQKLQIVEINRKDLIDLVALLLEHPLGSGDVERINTDRIAQLTADDWGLWRTVTMNLDRTDHFARESVELDEEQRARALGRIAELRRHIDEAPKGMRWRMRAKVGDRVKWYRDVEDLREVEAGYRTGADETGSGHEAS